MSAEQERTFFNIIDGGLRNSPKHGRGINPSNQEHLWEYPIATGEDINDAVQAAKKAFPPWAQTSTTHRKNLLGKLREAFQEYRPELATLLLTEGGKPESTALMELDIALTYIDHHIQLDIEEKSLKLKDKTITTRYIPLGVVAAICPWNFPVVLCLGKVLPALLTGNCVIVKPSPYTPYTALKVIEVAHQIFPPGVLQVLGGDDRLGPRLVEHPDIQKISFTGSTATGKKILAASAKTLKRVTLELGGNDPTIVLSDVDIEKVAPLVARGGFINSGQMCVAAKRIYIHESIYDSFVEAMVKAAQPLTTGYAANGTRVLGPVQNKMQYDFVRGIIEDSRHKGYNFAAGKPTVESSKGYFIEPTLIDNPPDDSRVVAEEAFGMFLPSLLIVLIN